MLWAEVWKTMRKYKIFNQLNVAQGSETVQSEWTKGIFSRPCCRPFDTVPLGLEFLQWRPVPIYLAQKFLTFLYMAAMATWRVLYLVYHQNNWSVLLTYSCLCTLQGLSARCLLLPSQGQKSCSTISCCPPKSEWGKWHFPFISLRELLLRVACSGKCHALGFSLLE